MKSGFIKVACAVPLVKVADCKYNVEQTEAQIAQAEEQGVEIIVFPELGITSYTCQDLFQQNLLLDASEAAVLHLLDFTRKLDVIVIVGLPIIVGDLLLNCGMVIQQGQIIGVIPKTYLPDYSEFYEKRWFASSQDLKETTIRYAGQQIVVTPDPQIFVTADGVQFGVEICEDVWAPVPPSNTLALAGADIIFNLSASDAVVGKYNYLKSLLSQQSSRTITGYVYAASGFGESTQDLAYAGNGLIYEKGTMLAEGKRFTFEGQMHAAQIDIEMLRAERRTNSTYVNAQRQVNNYAKQKGFADNLIPNQFAIFSSGSTIHYLQCLPCQRSDDFKLEREIDPHPFLPDAEQLDESCEEVLNIQSMALATRIKHIGSHNVVLGISGGLDSTLALLVCALTFDQLGYDRKGIIGVTMPGFGTTDRTYHNAIGLMRGLGITIKEIDIRKNVNQHFEDIGHDPNVHDVTYENSQARERTQILMDLSNKLGALVVGTGDMSELALGWATYNGDHMSMYGVNAGVPKTMIRFLVRFYAQHLTREDQTSRILMDIIDTPISPELTPADEHGDIKQKTEDLVGPYELHDFFLYYFLRFGFRPRKIFLLAKKAFAETKPQQQGLEGDSLKMIGYYDEENIKKWLKVFCKRFFSQQFKRSCLPDGPKVVSVSLSPRGDWRMPSDATSRLWLEECDSL
ncbi:MULTISPECIES: NAD(+) synthase [Prevotellaceae]|uniref:NAD(+) synthase n=1 Tax=Prevotellaceae TaxID=171552 RepID=UPI0003B86422|nr:MULTISPECIES: NAD(+) synthase [Prevotellaceae]ERT62127.1 putative NAD+ synthetase [Prevotella sp. BV3P1]KGF41805.1 NAD synthetase [Hoylesella buccalis DNF00985]